MMSTPYTLVHHTKVIMANYRMRHHIVTRGNPFSDEKSAATYINERIYRWMYDEIIIIVPKDVRIQHLVQNNICYYTVRSEELC